MPLKMENNLLNKELYYEKALNIQTKGRMDEFEDDDHHPYEATDYEVLELLVESNYIQKEDIVCDFGSGKGRVACFLSKYLNVKVIGIEFNETLYEIACQNAKNDLNIEFKLMDAQNYLDLKENIYFFFHPFPSHILRKVINNIIDSYHQNPRKIILIFYYPSSEYIDYLMHLDCLLCIDLIDCREVMHSKDVKEVLVVFRIEKN